MRFQEWIDQLSSHLGIESLETDNEGNYWLTFDDELTVSFISRGTREMILKGDIEDVPTDSGRAEDFLKNRLSTNAGRLKTSKEVLSIDPASRKLMISRRIKMMNHSVDDFFNIVERFVNALEFWKKPKEKTPPVMPPFPGMFS